MKQLFVVWPNGFVVLFFSIRGFENVDSKFANVIRTGTTTRPASKKSESKFGLRVRPLGIEWKTGRNPKWEKIGQKIENGPRPEMGKKWPKNGEKMGFYFFLPFLGHFFPISGRGPFSVFFANFFPFLDFSRFFILYQAA